MAYVTFCVISTLILIQIGSAKLETRVEMTPLIDTPIEGGILAIQCEIWNIQDGYDVTIVRTVDGQIERIASDDTIVLSSSIASRVFLAIRPFPDGSNVYFLTITDVLSTDGVEYGCTVSIMSGIGVYELLGRDSTHIKIYSFPGKGNPLCESVPNVNDVVYNEHDVVELFCSSETGIPDVELKWLKLGFTGDFVQTSSKKDNRVYTKLDIQANIAFTNTVFVCEMTSPAFPDRKRSCHIGPITISQSNNDASRELSRITVNPKIPMIDFDSKESTFPSDDCTDICTSSQVVFYLTVSTAAASLLCVLFFITTTLMCCKYHQTSRQVRQRNRYVPTPPSQVSDPVYVSLERRNTSERVYMTLEDPNNPDGKVLLPKEVFDEFYNRTLNLRKTESKSM